MDIIYILLDYSFLPVYTLTLVLSLMRFPKYFDTPLRFFPIIICYTLITELLGFIIRTFDEYDFFFNEIYNNYNTPIYNVYNVVFCLYFFYVFRAYIESDEIKNRIEYASILFVGITLANPLLQDFLTQPQFYSYICGALLLLYCVFEYFRQNRRMVGVYFQNRDLLSWIGLGMAIFYTLYIPIKIIKHVSLITSVEQAMLVRRITLSLIILMYGCYCLGLIRMYRMRYQKN
ncbi:hypothetical protein ACT6NV_10405 [Robiginitalea sp. IMCC44478]|uniref:hypothetical protein n=1 Tax=Robiginitalea sp. IMCC44478 TaxID=3459122 RepID=UPI0040426F9D